MAVLVALTSGCELSEDDEMAQRPKRTVTKSAAPAAPTKVPIGQGSVSPAAVVWAQDSTLHFGARQVDVSPLNIDSFVVVPGGVYFLSRGELWFTDLSRARGTGIMGVKRLSTTRDGGALRVEVGTGSGPAKVYAYDLETGASMPADQAVPATDADLRGARKRIVLRSTINDGASSETPVDVRLGTGGYAVVGGDGGGLVVVDATTQKAGPADGRRGDRLQARPVAEPGRVLRHGHGRRGEAAGHDELQPEQPQLQDLGRGRSRPLVGLRERLLTQGGPTTVPCPSRLG